MALFCACAMLAASDSLTEEGVAAFNQGRYSVALGILKRAAAAEPANPTTSAFLALAQAAQGDCNTALPGLRAQFDSGVDEIKKLTGIAAAKCLESAGDTPGALALLTRLEQRLPADADIIYARARLHMKAFNNATLAMYQRAPASYRVHQLSAEIFEVQGQFDSAVDEYRKAIMLNPRATDLHYRLGRAILMRSHDPDALESARAEFEAELAVNAEDAASEFQLGQIAQVQTKLDEAAKHFSRALELSPGFSEALVALGKIRTQQKQYEQAINLLERATHLQPENESAHYALMMAYRDSGRANLAKAEKTKLDQLQRPPEGEFSRFLKRLGEKAPAQ